MSIIKHNRTEILLFYYYREKPYIQILRAYSISFVNFSIPI